MLVVNNGYCWNALGHRLVAQIAYHHLTDHAKQTYNRYNHALDKVYRKQNLVNSAAWMDSLRFRKEVWLQEKHYIDQPFSADGTKVILPAKVNAVSAIEEAKTVLRGHSSDFDKGFSLRVLLHVVGDLHQPLHAINQFSVQYPRGDKGGNLVHLGKNSVAANLHAYWDRGGGSLYKKQSYKQLIKIAYRIEEVWPCQLEKMNLEPKSWAKESYQIAIQKAYLVKPGQKPDKKYQHMVKRVTEQRIALAGCRLAALLNALAEKD
ncbi:3'-nucleotidase/nuclease [Legionella maceachernii]|uniref:3'-nucleotidase/nuclease n=2 Tax=Legionellaceae TaxID=444 RepID=A0A0W0VU08_9GAMM|nr:S1/P1 nuclease [Legionella maceachernii]KTD23506.1 3'-nucleotidase/nuclease [Legionella maceachernii]SJZ70153.1 S1/P1 Nuclease [Legionella maceachernii]SUP02259.1 S1/P1 Nuclease [Legionella maceachernii]